jgi:hypothetical protein
MFDRSNTPIDRWRWRLSIWRAALSIAVAVRRQPLLEVMLSLRENPGLLPITAPPPEPAPLARDVARVVNRWTVPFVGPCLVRSLLLYGVLGPRIPGLGITLGFRTEGDAVPGHAWLSVGEQPLLDSDATAPSAYPCRTELP